MASRYARTLFSVGTLGSLSDGELLWLFISSRNDAAEPAFAVLVARHGPMVLRVCQSILGNEHDAQDALQSTFLVLVRRCRTVRNAGSLGSWLHGVALRVAGCARASTARRRMHERRAALGVSAEFVQTGNEPDFAHVLHDEVDRLPPRYREAIVLCYLEGLACETAALRLGLPVGTVKSRLWRGRERLRDQLIRRGVAPSGAILAKPGTPVLPIRLLPKAVESIARSAMGFAAGEAASAGAISAWVASITGKALFLMTLDKLARFAAVALVLAATMIGIAAFAQRVSREPPQAKAPGAAAGKKAAHDDGVTPVRAEPVIEKALQATEQIKIPWMRAYAFADIAAAQARLGQAEQSRATFRRAAEIIEGQPDKVSLQLTKLAWLAKAQAIAGDRAGTRVTIAKIIEVAARFDDPTERRQGLDTAVRWQAEGGNAEGALELQRAIKDEPASTLAYNLSVIAAPQARAGDLKGARVTMARADAEAERAEKEPPEKGRGPVHGLDPLRLAQVRGMAPYALAEAEAGDVDRARATLARARIIAERIGDDRRPEPLAQIAMAYRGAGDEKTADEVLKSALLIAQGLPNPWQRIEQFSRVAIVQADHGDRRAARETLDQAIWIAGQAPPGDSSLAGQCLSGARARAGDWQGGRLSALGQSDVFLQSIHVEGVCFEQARGGEAADALAWAVGRADPLLRAHALLGVVRGIIDQAARSPAK
jgi:RNA polymerase sigma factor (sigma-70 family)